MAKFFEEHKTENIKAHVDNWYDSGSFDNNYEVVTKRFWGIFKSRKVYIRRVSLPDKSSVGYR